MAKVLKGKTTPASGSIRGFKGDVFTDKYLVECKYTDKKQFTLKLDVLEKIEMEALLKNKIPLLAVEIKGKNYIIMKEEDFDG